MQRKCLIAAIGFLFLIFALPVTDTIPASAGSAVTTLAVLKQCQNHAIAATARIELCSELIRSNLLNHRMLGVLYGIRAEAYAEVPNNDLALQDYNKALELLPDFPQTFNNRAIVLQDLGRSDQAASDMEQAGLLFRKQNDCAKAIGEFNNSLAMDSKRALSLYGRGSCKQTVGDNAGGQSDIAAAVAIDPNVAVQFDKVR